MAKPAWKVLDRDQFDEVLLALGYAIGCASAKGDKVMRLNFLKLANKLNLGNPNYRPYSEDPEQFGPGKVTK